MLFLYTYMPEKHQASASISTIPLVSRDVAPSFLLRMISPVVSQNLQQSRAKFSVNVPEAPNSTIHYNLDLRMDLIS